MSPSKRSSGEGEASHTPIRRRRPHQSKVELDVLVEEATIDCYDESEQATGLYTMIDEHLTLPFQTMVLGVDVTVDEIDITDRDAVVVRCRRGSESQWLPVLDLPLPDPPPVGWRWIEAYRHWACGWR